MNDQPTAIIIGAGPAGLTAAYELLARTYIRPIVLERDAQYVGGISRSVNYKGNRIDIGGHRFFSASDRVMKWWGTFLPVKIEDASLSQNITFQNATRELIEGIPRATSVHEDRVLHIRQRKSRIANLGTFFSYPLDINGDTIRKLGFGRTFKAAISYFSALLWPIKPERSLEDFFINRFGRDLYETFFKTYTQKAWGIQCSEMPAQWGVERVKGISVWKAVKPILKYLTTFTMKRKKPEPIPPEQFLYPTYGPGQMWEQVAEKIKEKKGDVIMGAEVISIERKGKMFSVKARLGDEIREYEGAHVISSCDIHTLTGMMHPPLPEEVADIATHLQYRNLITVALLLEKPCAEKNGAAIGDTWMYVHDPEVQAARVQFFHNWSPQMVQNGKSGWIGLEYFCSENDAIWKRSDEELIDLARKEAARIGVMFGNKMMDATVVRQSKAYPNYFGPYAEFPQVQAYFDAIPELYLVGRSGMHRYNDQDHSMLAAMVAVDNIVIAREDHSNIWAVNQPEEFPEEK